jgi:pyruvate,water dikinase
LGASPHVLWFDEITRDDVAVAGGKGANLGELTAAGIPVPPGFVVTASSYRDVLTRDGRLATIRALFEQTEAVHDDDLTTATLMMVVEDWPDGMDAALIDAYHRLGAGLVAVRSSATAEDQLENSFAGQHETILNVAGDKDLTDAVRHCYGSMFHARAVRYREQAGIDHFAADMAVVVQRMVQSERSGVAFSVDPLTHSRGTIVIEAVRGLGEALVSGEVTPDMYAVDKATLEVRDRTVVPQQRELALGESDALDQTAWRDVPAVRRTRPKLNDDEIAQLAAIVRRVEEHYGAPQDVEWAEAGGEFFILQARPITTLQHAH